MLIPTFAAWPLPSFSTSPNTLSFFVHQAQPVQNGLRLKVAREVVGPQVFGEKRPVVTLRHVKY
ncbi:hypothetical protein M378DRAFT_962871 [Amanita muscaria Koide BX008]|uniref:Uncharacterized protein n=1 Tax=Amanita muscaria (strain Koide BX008) TaxID=946122 RepID=A0A0C2WUE3_AMAMK|nr:hypothetical protein M378DRAFT_962871 [Amanita muscaria Koide BX008]